jgi:putative effector of murein hydrolase LrgA (UPF0299 family)
MDNHSRQETEMTTSAPLQPSTRGHEAMRQVGIVTLFGVSTAIAYLGTRTQMPLLFVPLLVALVGVFLPRGQTARTVLLSIAAVGCVAVVAFGLFVLMVFTVLSGSHLG